MRKLLHGGQARFYGCLTAVVMGSALMASQLGTATYDLSSVSTTFTDQVSNAVTTALPIGAAIMALFVGWRVLRRIAKG